MQSRANPEIPQVLLILKEACEKFGYSWKLLDTYSNNLAEVSDGNKMFFSSNGAVGAYPLNLKFGAQLAKDKAWSYKVLQQKGYRVPKGDYFFLEEEYRELRGDGKELEDAITFAKNNYPVFVKPNSSSLGILAEIVNTEKELKNHLRSISEISSIALIQEVICLPEYRIFAVDGEVKFVYERLAAKIVGDGQTPILEYIAQMNQHIKRDRNKISEASVFVKHQLEKNGLSLDSVLKKGQELPVASKANISAGGQIKNYSKTVSAETSKWVKSIMKDMSLRVCGIDVFVEKSIDDPKGFIVIEINHNPNFSGIYELGHKDEVLKIWGEILEKHFSST